MINPKAGGDPEDLEDDGMDDSDETEEAATADNENMAGGMKKKKKKKKMGMAPVNGTGKGAPKGKSVAPKMDRLTFMQKAKGLKIE